MRFIGRMMVMICFVVMAGCGDINNTYSITTTTADAVTPSQRVGTVVVAKATGGPELQSIAFGQTNVEIMRIVIATSLDEDARIEYLVPEFYSGNQYGEVLPGVLQNIRVINQDGVQVGPGSASVITQEAASVNGWNATTFAWLPMDAIVPKGTIRTFRIVADIPWSLGVYTITPTLSSRKIVEGMFKNGISDHLVVRGVASGDLMNVTGEVIGSPIYLYNQGEKG